MCDVLCITNRNLCKRDFFEQVELIARANPAGIILREKDLSEAEYKELALRVLKICNEQGTECILHGFPRVAAELSWDKIHLPLGILKELSMRERQFFKVLGASCHSASDAILAESLGCTYITAGHVFETDCKAGLPGRGLEFLREVCEKVTIPVYGLGGISIENASSVISCGAKGVCVMSSAMTCDAPSDYFSGLVFERRG